MDVKKMKSIHNHGCSHAVEKHIYVPYLKCYAGMAWCEHTSPCTHALEYIPMCVHTLYIYTPHSCIVYSSTQYIPFERTMNPRQESGDKLSHGPYRCKRKTPQPAMEASEAIVKQLEQVEESMYNS